MTDTNTAPPRWVAAESRNAEVVAEINCALVRAGSDLVAEVTYDKDGPHATARKRDTFDNLPPARAKQMREGYAAMVETYGGVLQALADHDKNQPDAHPTGGEPPTP